MSSLRILSSGIEMPHAFDVSAPNSLIGLSIQFSLLGAAISYIFLSKSEPAHVNRLVVPLFGVPKRHCCRASAADKGCWVYPLDPRPDAVALCSRYTSGKRCAWCLPDDRHTASLVGLYGGWRHARMKFLRIYMDPMLLCQGKDLVLLNITIADVAKHSRF
ncbi:uncharacterized protein TNCV_4812331 [Trichonephila clavipes]|nr:uncharacterized protein TNCV_4812331 [Trichonephila clavipes]